jgi:hypothetical protein
MLKTSVNRVGVKLQITYTVQIQLKTHAHIFNICIVLYYTHTTNCSTSSFY